MPEEVPDKVRKLFLMFRNAVQREREAQRLYKRAVELCDDQEHRELLEGFGKGQLRHEKALVQGCNRLRKKYRQSVE
jgi:rubrerythrin